MTSSALAEQVPVVIYLVLNKGYLPTEDKRSCADLVDDAEWLAALLHRLMPTEPEVVGCSR